ncbi:hypothetical protein A3B05_03000 [Candidatus Giovannonibacteria bacterium RIFCSPLOWO2_01_FULL_43_160]|uniref:Uncharacterized protein n=1 Tax=Candidatus Giovannonibacteria bacterium RIFCSPLOWO2_12_FULL_43_26 TaxID=1798363 RepID=A0A1F5XVL9_9BACT|nr:MAG: hypothetical protein UV72_C0010G0009 [Candidatus Giovannonibacteria bacterium GW2011_GWB1_43_13]OGF58129.1 MAG: hypothetical protein A2652_02805 [Candidatus Giovannonibacteria bacterium RIFCSPHIGHO2_01_FULL_43_140]OGF70387.1 MAG: hypothetical protein A3C76_01310 [Candidatus Giovannonibacteria bacterium RIFCSPHIGHO2_02_FULL_44_51]OGF71381.1 MAG: hypothetical protein A3E35_03110 [Candidatus Giovannonibacteria bacterium RIFCSPHIGHO2_12_FULL_44_22]OGF74906.1 MAG: hypothetical protein A3B05_
MEENKKLVWWVAGIIAILVVAAFLVYYLRYTPVGTGDYGILPPSDTTQSIEADLNATDLNNLDSELSDIDKELAQ